MAEVVNSFDWRDAANPQILLPVQNQGPTMTCSTFAALECCSSRLALATNKPPIRFSVQQVADEMQKKFPRYCKKRDSFGNPMLFPSEVYRYVKKYGVGLDDYLPFRSMGKMPRDAPRLHISNFKSIDVQTPRGKPDYEFQKLDDSPAMREKIRKKIRKHTLVGEFLMSDALHDWNFAEMGMYTGPIGEDNCETQSGHAALVVGYGDVDGKEYYIVKCFWGKKWGHNGYGYIAADLFQGFTYPKKRNIEMKGDVTVIAAPVRRSGRLLNRYNLA